MKGNFILKVDRSIFSDIKELFVQLKLVGRLAKHYKVDSATIKRILTENGLDPDYYRAQEKESKKEALEYYQQGHTFAECVKRFGLSYQTLHSIAKKAGCLRNERPRNCECLICNTKFDRGGVFVKHLRDLHGFNGKTYYDTYCKKKTEGICVICGKEANYKTIFKGYSETCSSQSCSCTLFRKKLKADSKRYKEFVNKVKSNVTRMHSTMDPTEKQRRIQKGANKAKTNNSLLTDEERKQKFGWMNKLTPEEKERFIQDIMLQTGSHAWQKTASKKDKQARTKKASETALQKRLANSELYEQFKIYRGTVDLLTRKTYKKYRKEINPNLLPRRSGTKGYHLDHKYSAYQGFLDGLPVEIISSKYNLHVLPGSVNLSKSDKCCIDREELIRLYEQEKNTKV